MARTPTNRERREVARRSQVEVTAETAERREHEPERALYNVHAGEFGAYSRYILQWNHGSVSTFSMLMGHPRYRSKVKELLVNGSREIISPGDKLIMAIYSSSIVKVRVTWQDQALPNGRLDEMTSKMVLFRVLEALDGSHCPVRELILERVHAGLFVHWNQSTVLPAFQRLKKLTLHFEPSDKDHRKAFRNELGYTLRLCRNLHTLHLHFCQPPFEPSRSYSKEEVWGPPDFGELVEKVVFNKLEDLILENATLHLDCANAFFKTHARTLKKVRLISLWNLPAITPEESRILRGLEKSRLEEIRLRGRWIRQVPTDGASRCLLEVTWDDSNDTDLLAMREAERTILQGGKKPRARASSLDSEPLHDGSPWRKIKQCFVKLFVEKVSRKKDDR